MPAPIRRLTIDDFAALLRASAARLTRKIDAVHVHHTWRPTRSQFKGHATVEAMRNVHMNTNGWDDIAQHLTLDPMGFAWTGRNWNAPPASQKGKNGNASAGPFMIEVVGDFDIGRDLLDGEQRAALIHVLRGLLTECGLAADDIKFHRALGSSKTCPGSGVDHAQLLKDVQASLAAPRSRTRRGRAAKGAARRGSAVPPFDGTFMLGYDLTDAAPASPHGYDAWQIPEHDFSADAVRQETRARVRARAGTSGRDFASALQRGGEWELLRPHVVNLTKGRLSQGGEFEMPDGSIEFIIESIRDYAESTAEPRVMLHAHGGLVSERSALAYARDAHQWWTRQGVYPIYFVWETHLWELLKQRLGLARGPLGEVRDSLFERTARRAGGDDIWTAMKESARLASSVDAGDGEAGGARIFAEAFAQLVVSKPARRDIAMHLVGHSAGAIFQAHFASLMLGHGLDLDSLAFLAPAIRTDIFKDHLLQPIDTGRVKQFTMYTMEEEAERADDLVELLGVTVYGKSLLYLVSRAFESKRKTAILGLEEMLDADAAVQRLLSAPGRLELSRARGNEPNPATRALRHGCFDNDAATLASVFEQITGSEPIAPFPVQDPSCDPDAPRALRDRSLPPQVWLPTLPATLPLTGPALEARGARGHRRALCVGIDSYQDRPLAGCVRDAQTWARALQPLQFDVTTVLDRDATRQRVLDALTQLVTTARAGDVLVFQYAGHGTQVDDLNGDEADRFDEALVPVDYHAGALLLDDDLADVYRRLPSGVVLTLFMDCCHSGTNSRFAPIDRGSTRGSERRRFLELPPDVAKAHRRFRARSGSPAPTSPEESLPGVIHFAACLDNQFAYESEGQGHFTRSAATALAGAVVRGATNEDFGSEVAAKVIALGRPQTPRLMRVPAELSARAVLGGGAATAQAAPVPAVAGAATLGARDVDRWWLELFEAGAAYWRQRLGQ